MVSKISAYKKHLQSLLEKKNVYEKNVNELVFNIKLLNEGAKKII